VLGQGAVVLLITDGLDRDDTASACARDRAAAPVLPPADLAEPAAALDRLCAEGAGHPRHAAPCRQLSRRPFHRLARRNGTNTVQDTFVIA
jgi:hypothetical protein